MTPSKAQAALLACAEGLSWRDELVLGSDDDGPFLEHRSFDFRIVATDLEGLDAAVARCRRFQALGIAIELHLVSGTLSAAEIERFYFKHRLPLSFSDNKNRIRWNRLLLRASEGTILDWLDLPQ